jgi:hypothetical protein
LTRIALRRPLIIHRPSGFRVRHEFRDYISGDFGDIRATDALFGRLRIDRRGVGR